MDLESTSRKHQRQSIKYPVGSLLLTALLVVAHMTKDGKNHIRAHQYNSDVYDLTERDRILEKHPALPITVPVPVPSGQRPPVPFAALPSLDVRYYRIPPRLWDEFQARKGKIEARLERELARLGPFDKAKLQVRIDNIEQTLMDR